MDDFPNVRTAIQDGIDRQLHSAVQIYVSINGTPLLNGGLGDAAPGKPVAANTISLWRSAGKPLTAFAIVRACEKQSLSLDTTVGELLPGVGNSLVADVTVQQLLTHTSGLPLVDTGWPDADWRQTIQRVLSSNRAAAQVAYQPQATWFLLGEILQQIDVAKRDFQAIIHEDVLRPLGVADVWCGLPQDRVMNHADRIPAYYERLRGHLEPSGYGDVPWLTSVSPGGNFRGPISALGRFYEMLAAGGRVADGEPLVNTETVDSMTIRHRRGQFDQTFQHVVDFGLGLILDSNTYGVNTVPYGYGEHCSRQAFGHGGAQCSIGFCDPTHRLVVAWAANGFCGEGQHQRRNRMINEAVYRDLGLS